VRRAVIATLLVLLIGFAAAGAHAQDGEPRFPQPAFSSGYTQPETTTPGPRAFEMEYVDLSVLILALALASWLAIRGRSRRSIFLVTVFAVLYFGFYREGCVCAVGSLQNMTQAIMPLGVSLPLVVAAFFILPLATALFFGRTFCSSVCPLGAIQDLVVMRPVQIPRPLAVGLSLAAPLYLSLVLLFAATGAGYMICRFDPFVGFFRLTGSAAMIYTGAGFLVVGMVVARPYCRFLCPYGVLLKWLSKLSRHHLTITPDVCIQCRLCEDSCPFGAVRAPTELAGDDEPRAKDRDRLRPAIALLLFLVVIGGVAGFGLAETATSIHPTVALARELRLAGPTALPGESLRLEAFRQSARSLEDLYEAEEIVRGRFAVGAPLAGTFMGLMAGLQFLVLARPGRREGYEPDRGECLSCSRCVRTCPVEHVRVNRSKADFEVFLARMRHRGWGGRATDITAAELGRMMEEKGRGRDHDNGADGGGAV
jgi:NosR/NirI family nitrous oxide reductase transcriptional regulator